MRFFSCLLALSLYPISANAQDCFVVQDAFVACAGGASSQEFVEAGYILSGAVGMSSDGTYQLQSGIIPVCTGLMDVRDQFTRGFDFELALNYPNPFNPTTTIEFILPTRQQIQLVVYSLLGQRIGELASGSYSPGRHQVVFNGSGLASGVYFYQLVAGDHLETRKMVLVK